MIPYVSSKNILTDSGLVAGETRMDDDLDLDPCP